MAQSEAEFSFRTYLFPFTSLKAICLLIIIGFIVYFTMLFNGFVWDDLVFILTNPEVHHVSVVTAFGKNFFNNAGYYRPIPEFYFSFLYALFTTHAFFYHAIQLVLHISCTLLLFLLYKKFFSNPLAFILSVIFLVHPLNVESVSYIASSQSELVVLFGLSAWLLLLYQKASWKNAFFISFLLLLSLLTKETGAVFLAIWIFYTLVFDRKNLWRSLLLSLGIVSIYSLLRFGFAHVFFDKMGYAPITQLSLLQRIITIPSVILYYAKTFLYPVTLAIDQQWVITHVSFTSFYLPLIVDCFLIFSSIYFGISLYRNNRLSFKIFLLFLVFFLLSFGMILQIFPLDMTVADRWMYVPFIGLLGVVGVGLQRVKSLSWRKYIYSGLGIFIMLLSFRTVVRNSDWYNLVTLYTHDAAIEDSFDNENNLGVVLIQQGHVKAALSHFLKADNDYPTEFSLRNTAMAYLALKNHEKAQLYLEKAMQAKSHVLPPHKHQTATYGAYARYYLITKNYEGALKILEKGIADYPRAYTLWYFKAIAEYMVGNKEKALSSAKHAYTIYKTAETSSLYLALKNNLPLPITITD